MKKLLLLLFLFSLFCMCAAAQRWENIESDRRHRIMIGIGAYPFTSEGEFFSFNQGCYDYYDYYHYGLFSYYQNYDRLYSGRMYSPGALFVDYGYRFSRVVDFGFSFTYTGVYQDRFDSRTDKKVGTNSSNYLSLTPNIRLTWARSNWVNMYSGFGLGLMFAHHKYVFSWETEKFKEIYPSFNIILLGMSVGKGRYFGFTEFGFGTHGMVNCGLGIRL